MGKEREEEDGAVLHDKEKKGKQDEEGEWMMVEGEREMLRWRRKERGGKRRGQRMIMMEDGNTVVEKMATKKRCDVPEGVPRNVVCAYCRKFFVLHNVGKKHLSVLDVENTA